MAAIGAEAFEAEAQRLAALQTIDSCSPIQSIARYYHRSLIGMSDGAFDVLSRVCERLVEREPLLLDRLSYRCRNSQQTALSMELWLTLVRHARDYFDPAAHGAEFLVAKMGEGLSIREGFDALIASKLTKKIAFWLHGMLLPWVLHHLAGYFTLASSAYPWFRCCADPAGSALS